MLRSDFEQQKEEGMMASWNAQERRRRRAEARFRNRRGQQAGRRSGRGRKPLPATTCPAPGTGGQEPQFVPVPASCLSELLAPRAAPTLVLVVGGRYRIEVADGFDPATLGELIEALESVPC